MTKRLEQLEYERLTDEISPLVDGKLAGASALLQAQQVKLIMLAVLVKQATRVAQMLGMTRGEFEKRVAMLADSAYAPRARSSSGIVTP